MTAAVEPPASEPMLQVRSFQAHGLRSFSFLAASQDRSRPRFVR